MGSAARRETTPLDPHSFFIGVWSGEGDLPPSRLLRLVIPQQHFRDTSKMNWLTDSQWEVHNRYEFARGKIINLHLSIEMVGNRRLYATPANMSAPPDIFAGVCSCACAASIQATSGLMGASPTPSRCAFLGCQWPPCFCGCLLNEASRLTALASVAKSKIERGP